MKKILKLSTIIITIFLCFGTGKANNLEIGTPLVIERNTSEQYVKVQFDISWDNSWRTSEGPNNYDGIWLFVKYKKVSDGNWYHATLNTENISTGSQGTAATLQVRSDGIGAMFYRSADGNGTFSSLNVKLCWNYGIDGLANNIDELVTEYKVFGIEMVYVPEGAFYAGSGGNETGHFYAYGENTPYLITSEESINIGPTNGYLYYEPLLDFAGDGLGPLPAAFPKGYSAFWCMKYEITQEQYVDFLNTLTRVQQNTRTATDISGTSITNRYVMINSSNIQNRNGIRCDSIIPTIPNPVTFYCDLNGNGIINENDDGHTIACSFLSWDDGAAYTAWSGMRPMSELEYEKACRGNKFPVPNEYAWGDTTVIRATGIINIGTAFEHTIPENANCTYGAADSIQGSIRVGSFARANSTRENSGASFYGIMDLSSNLWERVVTIGNPVGRNYTALNGVGSLDSLGYASVANWPLSVSCYGSGFRGGNWRNDASISFISNRYMAARPSNAWLNTRGFRAIVQLD